MMGYTTRGLVVNSWTGCDFAKLPLLLILPYREGLRRSGSKIFDLALSRQVQLFTTKPRAV